MDDVGFEYRTVIEYYSLDYNMGDLKQLHDYAGTEKSPTVTNLEVSVEDGCVYYGRNKFEGIYIENAANGYVKSDDILESGYTVNA